ncbi:MAG TPA: hypothetical protein VFO34_03885 [Candidatus Acidoferrales bacterium]|nr:hypothetical protein [Candidatus Acidoferrales bacterium]
MTLCGAVCAQNTTAPELKLNPDQVDQVHGHLFSVGLIDKIPDRLSKSTGDVDVHYAHVSGLEGGPANQSGYPPYRLKAWACSADLVALVTAGSGTSHLNGDENFLYTDWAMLVRQALKNNATRPIDVGSAIVVTRPGGELNMNGRTVHAIDDNFKDFRSGSQYLLFLTYISQTGAYEPSAERAFVLSGGATGHLTLNSQHAELESKDPATLLKDTRAAVAAIAGWRTCSGGAEEK